MLRRDHLAVMRADISQARRRLAADSPRAFAKVYLKHHFKLKPSQLHEDLFDVLAKATQQRRSRIAIAAPRGHAKTTVASLAYILWSVIYGHEPFVLIVSATGELASGILRTIRDELQANEMIIEDHPELWASRGARAVSVQVRNNQLKLPSGALIRATGAQQAIRGVKNGPSRPTLIVIDDLEDQEQTESAEQRQKLRDWFNRTLLNAGEPRTNVVMVGTILHYDSLLANLTGSKGQGAGWQSKVYRAIESYSDRADLWDRWEQIMLGELEHGGNTGEVAASDFLSEHRAEMHEGARVLWPERESYEDLMLLRATQGRASFQAEKQNEPMDPDSCLFREEAIRYWDDSAEPEFTDADELRNRLGPRLRFHGACDPSLGRSGRGGDYTAIVTVAVDTQTDRMYVVDADIARRRPEQTIRRIVELSKIYDYEEFSVETNQFQELLAEQLETRLREQGRYMRLERVNHTGNKKARIQSLEPWVASGRLRFSRRHAVLLEQLRQFPLGAHDDGPDALEMAVSIAIDSGPRLEVLQM